MPAALNEMQVPKKRVSIGSLGICHRLEGRLWRDTVEKPKFSTASSLSAAPSLIALSQIQ
jgi:hypothetical protein